MKPIILVPVALMSSFILANFAQAATTATPHQFVNGVFYDETTDPNYHGKWSGHTGDTTIIPGQVKEFMYSKEGFTNTTGALRYYIEDETGNQTKYYFQLQIAANKTGNDNVTGECKLDPANTFLGDPAKDFLTYTPTITSSAQNGQWVCDVAITSRYGQPTAPIPKFETKQTITVPNSNVTINKTRFFSMPVVNANGEIERTEQFLILLIENNYDTNEKQYHNCRKGALVYRWDGNQFGLLDDLSQGSCAVTDAQIFNTSPAKHVGDNYLMLSNSHDKDNYVLNTSLWKYNKTSGHFESQTNSVSAIGANKLEILTSGDDTYLFVGNGGGPKDGYVQYSKFYKWNKTSIKFDEIPVTLEVEGDIEDMPGVVTKNLKDVVFFKMNNIDYFAVVNGHGPINFNQTMDVYRYTLGNKISLTEVSIGTTIMPTEGAVSVDYFKRTNAQNEELNYLAVVNQYSDSKGYKNEKQSQVFYWDSEDEHFIEVARKDPSDMGTNVTINKQWEHFNIEGYDYLLLSKRPYAYDTNSGPISARVYAWEYNTELGYLSNALNVPANTYNYYLARDYNFFEVKNGDNTRYFMSVVVDNKADAVSNPDKIPEDQVIISEITL